MRGYGAGTVFQRSDRKWVAMWERPPLDGKRRRGSRVADTEAEAWRKMRAAQRSEGSSSRSPKRTGETVGAFLDRWLRDVVSKSRRERTLVGYRSIVRAIPDGLRDVDLRDPHAAHLVQAFLSGLSQHPRTVHHYAACLRTAFGYARRKGLIDVNPAADLDLPAIPRADRRPWSRDDRDRFLSTTTGPLAPLWLTAAWTGLRQGELLGLRWEDVDLERGSLVVNRSLSRLPGRRGYRYLLTEPKTRSSRRTVPLVPVVVRTLRNLRKRQLAAPGKLDQGLVFCTEAGSPLDGPWVSYQFRRAIERAGMPRVRLHDLRHGFATYLIEQGTDLATVAAILGHSNIGTTVDIYGHLTEQHKRSAVERLASHG